MNSEIDFGRDFAGLFHFEFCDEVRETVLLSVTAHDYIIDIVHHRNVLIKMDIFRWR